MGCRDLRPALLPVATFRPTVPISPAVRVGEATCNRSRPLARNLNAQTSDAHGMHEGGVDRAAAIVGLFVGLLTAGGLYLWQGTTQVAVAAFVIFGHISWMWMATRSEVLAARHLYGAAIDLPGNNRMRRFCRMLRDPSFWWSLLFGGVMVVGSVRYAGMKEPIVLGLVGLGWTVIALYMNFGLTIVHPTTKCRRCRYDLIAHLTGADDRARVTCPECGARWRKGDLCPQQTMAREQTSHAMPARA